MAWSSFRDGPAAEPDSGPGWPAAPDSEVRPHGPSARPGKGDVPSNPPSVQERQHPDREVTKLSKEDVFYRPAGDPMPGQAGVDQAPPLPDRPGAEVRTDLTPRSWEERQ